MTYDPYSNIFLTCRKILVFADLGEACFLLTIFSTTETVDWPTQLLSEWKSNGIVNTSGSNKTGKNNY